MAVSEVSESTIQETENTKKPLLSRKMLWIGLLAGIVLLMVSVGFAAWKFGFFESEPEHPMASDSAVSSKVGGKGSGSFFQNGNLFDLPAINSHNLISLEPCNKIPLDDSKPPACLDVKVAVKVTGPEVRVELDKKMFILHEIVVSSIKMHAPDDIRGIEGKLLFKKELLEKLNGVLENGVIEQLFFVNFLIEFEA